jgi:hypothetical protein
VLNANITYIPARAIRRLIPILSLAAGLARLPEQWAAAPRGRTPAANALSLSAALDVPMYVRPRAALLLGWETGVLPNAPGDPVRMNALVLTLRGTRAAPASR